jgi:hypothetical protein
LEKFHRKKFPLKKLHLKELLLKTLTSGKIPLKKFPDKKKKLPGVSVGKCENVENGFGIYIIPGLKIPMVGKFSSKLFNFCRYLPKILNFFG